jgi:predicted Rossmann fold flavoprotein
MADGTDTSPLIVIGAGAAGLIAAWRAASLGAPVLLLERNRKPGIKLLISGGGRCNITHSGDMEALRLQFLPREGRFLKPAFHRFTNRDIVRIVEEGGVPTTARQDGRVFPAAGAADDVVRVLVDAVERSGVRVRAGTRALRLVLRDGAVAGVETAEGFLAASRIIVAVGGASYPKTGTTGDGYRWAAAAGHTVVPIRPALAPIGVDPPLSAAWRGVALRGGELMLVHRGRKRASWAADILFSHEGVTGPAALGLSREAALAREEGEAELRFDFFPDEDHASLDALLNREIAARRSRMLGSLLEEMLPDRIVPALLTATGVDPAKRGHVIRRDERRRVVGVLKEWRLGNVGPIVMERGEVSAGGVELDEVDPQTMRSRRVRGLYLCGEVLDIAGPVGGYNLQAAFSTGFVAGETAARDHAEAAS